MIGPIMGKGLLNMDGPEHSAQRKMMNPAFATSYMDRYLPIMNRVIETRTADWAARGVVDLYDEARKITFDVAAEALVGFQGGAFDGPLPRTLRDPVAGRRGARITMKRCTRRCWRLETR